MIRPDVKYGAFPSSEVVIDPRELSARIGRGLDLSDVTLTDIIDKFNKKARYRYAYCVSPVSVAGECCDFGFASVNSRALSSLLSGCDKAILLATTAGIDIDRLISRLSTLSRTEAFLTDAVGSAAIESFCDLICAELEKSFPCTKRFSPGYADLPLKFQSDLLGRLDATASVGITLNSSLLMTPMKSITAVIGIKEQ